MNSPALPLEELARILADHWDCLSDEAKTPYKNRATEEGHRQEALGAAVVLTQVFTACRPLLVFFCSMIYQMSTTYPS